MENSQSQYTRYYQREHNLCEYTEFAHAVHSCRFLQILRKSREVGPHHKDAECRGGLRQNQSAVGVQKPQQIRFQKQRNHHNLERYHHGKQHQHEQEIFPLKIQPRERIAR